MQKLFHPNAEPSHSESVVHGSVQPPISADDGSQVSPTRHWLLAVQGSDKPAGPGKQLSGMAEDGAQCAPGQSEALVHSFRQTPLPLMELRSMRAHSPSDTQSLV